MSEEMGIATGVNLERLVETVLLAVEIVGPPLLGSVRMAARRSA